MKWAVCRGYTKDMMLRRSLSAFALSSAIAVFVAAQDVRTSGDPAAAPAPAVPPAAAPTAAVPAAAAPQADAPKKTAAKTKKKAAKGKKKAAVESRYKTRALSENSDSHYRFDADGNPIDANMKSASKETKKSSTDSKNKPACTDDAPCSDKKSSDADAL